MPASPKNAHEVKELDGFLIIDKFEIPKNGKVLVPASKQDKKRKTGKQKE